MKENSITQVYAIQKLKKFDQKATTVEYRLKKLQQLKVLILDNISNIESALQKDFGKAPMESTMSEILPTITMLNTTIKNLKKWMKPKSAKASLLFFGASNKYHYQAKGNVLMIAPWNYPFQLSMVPFITSFSAGNTTLLKPSEFTPHINKVILEICSKVFLEHEFAMIEGEAETSQQLLDLPFDHIFFTGSTNVGKLVMEKASKHLASVTLELGGKSPALIAPDYDLSKAAKNIVWGKLVNSGQTCVAPDYVLVPKDKYKELIPLLIKQIEERYGSDIGNNADFCRIITPRHAARLKSLVDEAQNDGAILESGGDILVGNKISPTILSNLSESMTIMKEEIFGPLLPIIPYENINEAISFINKHDNALALYLFTDKKEYIDIVLERTNSGGVGINETLMHVGNMNLAFGGAGTSGIGRYHDFFGFAEFSNVRAVYQRKFSTGLEYFFPPYTNKKYNILEKLLTKFNRFL